MRTNVRAFVAALALGIAGASFSPFVLAASAQTAPMNATRKGVIKKIDDATVVLTPSDDKKREATYTLAPAATRTGQCDVGDDVVITYHYEKGQPIVTAVAGK
jgi:hypothetical protein